MKTSVRIINQGFLTREDLLMYKNIRMKIAMNESLTIIIGRIQLRESCYLNNRFYEFLKTLKLWY